MGGFQWKLPTFFYVHWRCTPIQMLYEIWLFSIVLVSHIEKWILSYHTWGGTHHLSTIRPWPVNGFQWNMCKSTAKWSDLRWFSLPSRWSLTIHIGEWKFQVASKIHFILAGLASNSCKASRNLKTLAKPLNFLF